MKKWAALFTLMAFISPVHAGEDHAHEHGNADHPHAKGHGHPHGNPPGQHKGHHPAPATEQYGADEVPADEAHETKPAKSPKEPKEKPAKPHAHGKGSHDHSH